MKTVIEAQDIILDKVGRPGVERVPVTESLGRVLVEDVHSNRNHPPYDISAMDGYALKFADIGGATRDEPVILKVVDDIRAGTMPNVSVGSGEASRIMTGAPVPEGADTVIRVEDTSGSGENVKILVPSGEGANIRLLGENLKVDDKLLSTGTEITPAALGTLAMVKYAEVPVYRRPTVAILSTGDELEALGEPFDETKIPDANSYTVMAELKAIGIDATLLGIARDTREELAAKLKEGMEYDVLIVSGGVSVGHHDFVRPCLEELGIKMLFWRVALRPGHPFAFGAGEGDNPTLVFGLPGNPVSSMVCCAQFIVPALRKMMGKGNLFRGTFKARLGGAVKDRQGRLHFMRVKVDDTPKGPVAKSTGSQGSGILMSMVEADALMIVPASRDSLEDGEVVTVQPLRDIFYQSEPGFKGE